MDISEKIKEIRKSKKLTQAQFAKKINKSERMLQKYENGEVIPSLEVIELIATALGVKPYDLMSEALDLTSMDNTTLNFLYGNPDLILLVDIFKRCGYRLEEDNSIVKVLKDDNTIAEVPEKEFIELGRKKLEYINEFSEFQIGKLVDNYKFLY